MPVFGFGMSVILKTRDIRLAVHQRHRVVGSYTSPLFSSTCALLAVLDGGVFCGFSIEKVDKTPDT